MKDLNEKELSSVTADDHASSVFEEVWSFMDGKFVAPPKSATEDKYFFEGAMTVAKEFGNKDSEIDNSAIDKREGDRAAKQENNPVDVLKAQQSGSVIDLLSRIQNKQLSDDELRALSDKLSARPAAGFDRADKTLVDFDKMSKSGEGSILNDMLSSMSKDDRELLADEMKNNPKFLGNLIDTLNSLMKDNKVAPGDKIGFLREPDTGKLAVYLLSGDKLLGYAVPGEPAGKISIVPISDDGKTHVPAKPVPKISRLSDDDGISLPVMKNDKPDNKILQPNLRDPNLERLQKR